MVRCSHVWWPCGTAYSRQSSWMPTDSVSADVAPTPRRWRTGRYRVADSRRGGQPWGRGACLKAGSTQAWERRARRAKRGRLRVACLPRRSLLRAEQSLVEQRMGEQPQPPGGVAERRFQARHALFVACPGRGAADAEGRVVVAALLARVVEHVGVARQGRGTERDPAHVCV